MSEIKTLAKGKSYVHFICKCSIKCYNNIKKLDGPSFSDGQQPLQILIHNNHRHEVRLGPLGQCIEENKKRGKKETLATRKITLNNNYYYR